jgi:hypothetical protein
MTKAKPRFPPTGAPGSAEVLSGSPFIRLRGCAEIGTPAAVQTVSKPFRFSNGPVLLRFLSVRGPPVGGYIRLGREFRESL